MTDEIAPKRGPGRPKKVVLGEAMPAADCEAIIAECEVASNGTEKINMAHASKTHVTMKRNPDWYAAPHTANVHLDEVDNWAKHGWKVAD